ncbi:UTP--glucose-1-phosphate uridylyltransferase [Devosia nitrariae]|uniref:UTP--glucose-1-phosphate uridylyltransferase n=1 Tax=Devosia nitrariae TaxID=2071872 RepID=A0ABQ5WBJ7_9HYPH|nr:UTP--glucose-1-phosphate uridylyltransferase [Devosia nitrariae]GLQ56905.1 hypothetical protein GCM10010862_41640 [Devosia nitrariae]
MKHAGTETPAQYDAALFERLREQFARGNLKRALRTDLRYATPADLAQGSTTQHVEAGWDLIAQGGVGAAILAGGLATRFGGEAKAAVDLVPGWPLLRIKLEALESIAARRETTLPVIVIVSFATENAVRRIIDEHAFRHLAITLVRQTVLPRIDPEGRLVRETDGGLSFNPPGHGEVLHLLAAHGFKAETAPIYWQISNIDNLLAILDPGIVGAHAASGAHATVEAAPGTSADVGGYLAIAPRGFEIIEGFQVEAAERPKGAFFLSTNTFIVGRSTAQMADKLPYHAVSKTMPDDRNIIQFEQLLGDIGSIAGLNAIAVPRGGVDSRFTPIKRLEDLDDSRAGLVEALTATGLIRW